MPWGTEMPDRLRDRFVELIRKALDPDLQKRTRNKMMADAQRWDWSLIAKSWSNLWKYGKRLSK
jgi:hypothetical protein